MEGRSLMVRPTAEERGGAPAAPRRKMPLAVNSGRRTIRSLSVTLDDGTTIAWSGTGSVVLTGTSASRQIPAAKNDVFFADAILRVEDPDAMAVRYADDPDGAAS